MCRRSLNLIIYCLNAAKSKKKIIIEDKIKSKLEVFFRFIQQNIIIILNNKNLVSDKNANFII